MRLVDALWRLGLKVAFRALQLYWIVVRPVGEGVYVGVWNDGRVLVIRNSYKAVHALPAGLARRSEPLALAAARELEEEVGIRIPPGALRYVRTIRNTAESRIDHAHFFEIELEAEPALRPDGREVIWAGFETPGQALRRPLAPPVRTYLLERGEPAAPGDSPGG